MRHVRYLALPALLACGCAQAEGARLGFEYEFETDRKTGIRNHAVTAQPGWDFASDRVINRVELLIDHNEDAVHDESGLRAHENKLFVRLRHSRSFTEHASYYLRGGVGRSFSSQRNFSYAYVEPGLKFELSERWEWTFGVRHVDALDGTDGQRVRKYITGPSFALDTHNELELRYARGRGDKDFWSLGLGYVHRF
jgi:hypothetical protein